MKFQCPKCNGLSCDYPEGDTASCGPCGCLMLPYKKTVGFDETVVNISKECYPPEETIIEFKGKNIPKLPNDKINPSHYKSHPSGIECISITRHMSFNIGNAIKYLWRCDLKNGLEDLKKAAWYIQDEIKKRENDNTKS